jgi:hypothetical protein
MTRNAQLNAMCALRPHLKLQGRPEYRIPRGAKDIGDGYVLLRPCDQSVLIVEPSESAAIQAYLEVTQPTAWNDFVFPSDWEAAVCSFSL